MAKSKTKASSSEKKELTNFAISGAFRLTMGRMYGFSDKQKSLEPVKVFETSVLGTQSQYGAKKKGANNPQRIEIAYLPKGCDSLRIVFGLTIARGSNYGMESCNLAPVHARITELHSIYNKHGGYAFLAEKYVNQLANGSFMWRNKYGTGLVVKAELIDEVETQTGKLAAGTVLDLSDSQDKKVLVELVGKALGGDLALFRTTITGEIKLVEEAQVYPSQDMVIDADKYGVGRILAKDDDSNALIHSQKIGNALRTIDIWHKDSTIGEDTPIPVEPYGTVLRQGGYSTRETVNGFYDYLTALVDLDSEAPIVKAISEATDFDSLTRDPKTLPGEDVHFFMAILIRGGVFGLKNSKGGS